VVAAREKIGGGLIAIHKEASLQLQFGYVLQQILPLITFHESEQLEVELESGAKIGGSFSEIDVLLTGTSQSRKHRIAVELKCYRTLAWSGGKRGATDIFMKDVYEDLAILERYVECGHVNEGLALVMRTWNAWCAPATRPQSAVATTSPRGDLWAGHSGHAHRRERGEHHAQEPLPAGMAAIRQVLVFGRSGPSR